MSQIPTIFELVSFLKMFSACFDSKNMSISKEEKKAAYDLLKKASENRQNLTEEQKELYAVLVEYGKETIEME